MSSRPLVVRSVDFLGPMEAAGGWRPETNLPQIALSGRSNVGKSSLINKLLGRRDVARVSKTPGRTRAINFFEINGTFVLADLPGYGYARIARETKQAWGPLIEDYLRNSSGVRGVIQLIDIRHPPTDDDRAMLDFLAHTGLRTIVVLTKSDKLKASEVGTRRAQIANELGIHESATIPFSAQTGAGRDDLARAIEELLEAK